MSAKDHAAMSPIGLDIGTSRIVVARRPQDEFQYDSQLNAFATIPFSKLTQGVLVRERIPHEVQGSEIVVFGNESEKFADLFHAETRRPMRGGIVNPDEPHGLALIRSIVEHMIGQGDPQKGQKLYFSMPGTPIGSNEDLKFHEATLTDVLGGLGYQVRSINEGLAVIFSELEDTSYSGIGVSCGGGMCNICLSYLSVPVVTCSITKAGDFVDASAGSATGEIATRVRVLKEQSFHFDISSADRVQQALTIYYDELIRSLVAGMEQAFVEARVSLRLHRPVPVVLSGGSAMPEGFRDRFEKVLRQTAFPVPVSEVRLAKDPLQSTARGALVAALAEM